MNGKYRENVNNSNANSSSAPINFSTDMLFVTFLSCFLVFSLTSAFKGQQVKPGENISLQCQAPTGAAITVLEWRRSDLKSGVYVFLYRNGRSYEKYQHPSFRGRVELRDPEMKDGNVSVILKNATINDTGTYECQISSSNKKPFNKNITLTVTDSGDTAGSTEVEEETDKITNDGGKKDVNVSKAVGLSVAVLLLGFVGFMIFRKLKERLKQRFYEPPSEISGEQQQV